MRGLREILGVRREVSDLADEAQRAVERSEKETEIKMEHAAKLRLLERRLKIMQRHSLDGEGGT